MEFPFRNARPKTVRIYQFKGTCPEHEDAPIVYENIQLINMNRTFFVSMRVKVKRNLSHGLKLRLSLSRCANRESLDSCETYSTIKLSRFCKLLVAEKEPWTAFVKRFSPPMACPLKKGTYIVNNGTFDGSAFDNLPVVNWYWKVLINILDEVTNDLLLCATIEGQVAPI
ncbi:hypothetical protein NQ318_013560 [Aromia moschata]|uniref:Uncharacterized protein n=1 Tax=Aromia moschata TaxID=1265417 RepID=A0AAV8XZR1_9CUCU|nr:hypothetical protein NQ318_013560 [Aromia moschata]